MQTKLRKHVFHHVFLMIFLWLSHEQSVSIEQAICALFVAHPKGLQVEAGRASNSQVSSQANMDAEEHGAEGAECIIWLIIGVIIGLSWLTNTLELVLKFFSAKWYYFRRIIGLIG